MYLQSILASTAIKAESIIYRLTFPSVEEVIENGSGAMEDGGALSDMGNKVDELGGAATNVTYKAVIWLFIIGIFGAAVGLYFSSSSDRVDKKTSLIYKAFAAILAFAGVGIIGFMATIGGGLFN